MMWKLREPIKAKTENHKIEPNLLKDRAMHEGDNQIYKIYFVLDSLIHIRIFKQVPKYLTTGL
jgi:hypothetical protein